MVEDNPNDQLFTFEDITSHRGFKNKGGQILLNTPANQLKNSFEKMSWNNIPIPLKELLKNIIDYELSDETKGNKWKFNTNERVIELQKKLRTVQLRQN